MSLTPGLTVLQAPAHDYFDDPVDYGMHADDYAPGRADADAGSGLHDQSTADNGSR